MAEDLEIKNIQIQEANKLDGASNYQAWKVKMRALFRREGLWEIVERKTVTYIIFGDYRWIEREQAQATNNKVECIFGHHHVNQGQTFQDCGKY